MLLGAGRRAIVEIERARRIAGAEPLGQLKESGLARARHVGIDRAGEPRLGAGVSPSSFTGERGAGERLGALDGWRRLLRGDAIEFAERPADGAGRARLATARSGQRPSAAGREREKESGEDQSERGGAHRGG